MQEHSVCTGNELGGTPNGLLVTSQGLEPVYSCDLVNHETFFARYDVSRLAKNVRSRLDLMLACCSCALPADPWKLNDDKLR